MDCIERRNSLNEKYRKEILTWLKKAVFGTIRLAVHSILIVMDGKIWGRVQDLWRTYQGEKNAIQYILGRPRR